MYIFTEKEKANLYTNVSFIRSSIRKLPTLSCMNQAYFDPTKENVTIYPTNQGIEVRGVTRYRAYCYWLLKDQLGDQEFLYRKRILVIFCLKSLYGNLLFEGMILKT